MLSKFYTPTCVPSIKFQLLMSLSQSTNSAKRLSINIVFALGYCWFFASLAICFWLISRKSALRLFRRLSQVLTWLFVKRRRLTIYWLSKFYIFHLFYLKNLFFFFSLHVFLNLILSFFICKYEIGLERNETVSCFFLNFYFSGRQHWMKNQQINYDLEHMLKHPLRVCLSKFTFTIVFLDYYKYFSLIMFWFSVQRKWNTKSQIVSWLSL